MLDSSSHPAIVTPAVSTMDLLCAVLLVLGAVACWGLNLFAIPASNWIMIALAALYAWQGPDSGRLELGWVSVLALAVLAALGELVEFLAGAMGVGKVGGSRRSAVLAIIGSIAGGFLGMVIAIPIPVIGPVVGALLLGGAGALGGALLGERWKGRDWKETWQVGKAAFWGRLLGTCGKVVFSSVMVALIVTSVVL